MNAMRWWVDESVLVTWGWALAYSVWVGLLLTALWASVQFALRGRSPRVRYRTGCAFLVALAITPVLTFWLLRQALDGRNPSQAMAMAFRGIARAEQAPEGVATFSSDALLGASRVEQLNGVTDALAPWIGLAWVLGVTGMGVRLLVGWRRLVRVRRAAGEVEETWLRAILADLRRRLGIRATVGLRRTTALSVPALVGWRHPVILLPATALDGLSQAQVELLLAHELAHFRRGDPWVNLGQIVIEALWYFQPGVWWISGRVRAEREHCCDDEAIGAAGDPHAYATALVTLEELRQLEPALGLGAGGGSLLQRIRRLLGLDPAPRGWRRMAGAVLLVLGTLSIVAAFVAAVISPARYEAVVRLQVDQPESVILTDSSSPPDRAAQDDYLEVLRENLASRSLLQSVARRERLSDWRSFSTALDVVERLQRCVDVRSVGPGTWTRLLEVRVTLEEPPKAASVANTLAEEFIDWMAARRNERASSQLFFLRNQASGLEGEVIKAEEDLHNYRIRTKYTTFDPEQNLIAQAFTRAELDYIEAVSRANAASALVGLLDRHIANGKPLETFARIGSDPQIQRLRTELARLELEHAQRSKSQAPGGPELQESQAKLEDLQSLITRLAEHAAELMRGEAEVSRALQQEQERLVKEYEIRMFEWHRARMEYQVLSRKAAAKIALYNQVLARVNELDLGQRERVNNIRVVDRATPPMSPVHPLRKLAILLFAAGVISGIAGIALTTPRGAPQAAAGAS